MKADNFQAIDLAIAEQMCFACYCLFVLMKQGWL